MGESQRNLGEIQRNLGESQKMGETKGKFYKLKVDKRVREKKNNTLGESQRKWEKVRKILEKVRKIWEKVREIWEKFACLQPCLADHCIPMNQS